jgi:hypothetical protein
MLMKIFGAKEYKKCQALIRVMGNSTGKQDLRYNITVQKGVTSQQRAISLAEQHFRALLKSIDIQSIIRPQ